MHPEHNIAFLELIAKYDARATSVLYNDEDKLQSGQLHVDKSQVARETAQDLRTLRNLLLGQTTPAVQVPYVDFTSSVPDFETF